MKIAFLVPSLDGSEITRAYPFAKLLQKKHEVKIYGKNPTGKLYIENEMEIAIPDKKLIHQMIYLIKELKNYDIICISKPRFCNVLVSMVLKFKGKRLIVDIDDDECAMIYFNQDENTISVKIRNLIKYIITIFNFQIVRFADTVIVASTILQKKYNGHIVAVPIDTSFFDYKVNSAKIREKYQCKHLIVYTGAIRRFKGIDTLIRSCAILEKIIPDVKLLIVGPLFPNLKYYKEITTLAHNTSKNIILTDFVDYETIPEYMAAADILITTNPNNIIHKAQCPIKLIEYMAMKKPIISTDVGDTRKILDDGMCGMIIKPESPEEISKAIIRLVNDEKLSKKIASNAYDKCNRFYSFKANYKKIEKYYCG